jgi:hypothetical protein
MWVQAHLALPSVFVFWLVFLHELVAILSLNSGLVQAHLALFLLQANLTSVFLHCVHGKSSVWGECKFTLHFSLLSCWLLLSVRWYVIRSAISPCTWLDICYWLALFLWNLWVIYQQQLVSASSPCTSLFLLLTCVLHGIMTILTINSRWVQAHLALVMFHLILTCSFWRFTLAKSTVPGECKFNLHFLVFLSCDFCCCTFVVVLI